MFSDLEVLGGEADSVMPYKWYMSFISAGDLCVPKGQLF